MAEAPTPAANPAAPALAGNPAASSAPPTDAGAKPKATPVEQTQPEIFEHKVNGKVRRYTKEELLAKASLADAADERFNEGAKMRKEAEKVIGRLKDPEQVMDALMDPALGYSKEQIRERFEAWYEREFIEPEKLTEEGKKLREAKHQIKKYAEDEKKREQAKAQAENEELTDKARGEIQKQIIEALDTGTLPKTNFTVRRLAFWIQRNKERGFNAPTSLLVSQVRNEFNSSIRDMVESSDGESLIQLLGDGIVQKIRKYDLEQLRKMRGMGNTPAPDTGAPPPTESKREHSPTMSDVTQKMRELQRTGRY